MSNSYGSKDERGSKISMMADIVDKGSVELKVREARAGSGLTWFVWSVCEGGGGKKDC